MANAKGLIAVVPCSRFKWTAQIEYKESLSTRDEAIRFASEHGYNLIVKYERRPGQLFDVLRDPNLVCTSEDGSETVEVVAALDESEFSSPSKRRLGGLAGMIKWLVGSSANTSRQEKATAEVHSQALAAK